MFKRLELFAEEVKNHYKTYGWEKAHYLKEIIEKHIGEKIEVDGGE